MNVEVNLLAVLLAGVSSMVVGMVWYSPGVFGNAWMKMTGVKMDRGDSGTAMAWKFGSTFVASLVTAYILAHVAFLSNNFFANSFMMDALTTGFWLWLGFTAARLYVHDAFEGRRKKLFLINSAHELATIMVMALIIGLIKP